MLFVRPIIQMNSWRKNKRHIMVFFIFLVSNIGGCLTPIGDPPLLMGFSRGVSFFWSMRLFPVLVLNMILLLTIFYHLDKKAYQKDITKGLMPEVKENEPLIRIKGAHNFLYIVMIVIAVILSGVLPKLLHSRTLRERLSVFRYSGRLHSLCLQSLRLQLFCLQPCFPSRQHRRRFVCRTISHGEQFRRLRCFHRNLHHHAACSYGIKECRFRSWNHKAV